MLTVAAFATVSLVLLLTAYLSSDLFRPLRRLQEALEGVARGGFNQRLDAERQDEFGAVNRAFNAAAAAARAREQPPGGLGAQSGPATSSRVLHGLLQRLQAQVAGLGGETPEQRALLESIGELSRTAMRLGAFSFPLDLTLAKSDLRALLYEVVVRFHERFAERAVNVELRLDPELGEVMIDRLKLREVLSELLENALDALPERGGSVGLRALRGEDGTFLLEVADNGRGVDAARGCSSAKPSSIGTAAAFCSRASRAGGPTCSSSCRSTRASPRRGRATLGRVKYLLLSDVHANIGALEAVLAHAAGRGWDAVLFLGDAVGYGGAPNEVLDRLRGLAPAVSLRGNHEAMLLKFARTPSLRAAPSYSVTRAQAATLSDANRAFVEGTVTVHLDGAWGAVHGALRAPWEYLVSVPVARANEPLMKRPLYFVGHTHIPAVFARNAAGRWTGLVCRGESLVFAPEPGGAAFVNPGSVGGPRDGLGASYGLYDGKTGRVSLFRLPV